ncbi:MAG: LLM class F420-dependent oxidoreductase [Alphaproteobacteria bacterium]
MSTFGIFTFATDYSLDPARLAREVEDRGFESLFLPEHSHIPACRTTPYPGGGELPREYSHTHDLFVAMTAAAAATTKLKLASGICLITEHNPIRLAKAIASLDQLSGGRVLLGVGVGWNVEEMVNHGVPFRDRWKIMRERILAMKRIWAEDEPEYHGDFVDFDPVWSFPKPHQRSGPPVLIGANSKWVFDRVADYADGWLPINPFPGRAHEGIDLAEGIRRLEASTAKAGRDMKDIDLTVFGLGPDPAEVEKLIKLGFNRIVFHVPPAEDGKVLRLLDRYQGVTEMFAS